jgi:hypothetical protein
MLFGFGKNHGFVVHQSTCDTSFIKKKMQKLKVGTKHQIIYESSRRGGAGP